MDKTERQAAKQNSMRPFTCFITLACHVKGVQEYASSQKPKDFIEKVY